MTVALNAYLNFRDQAREAMLWYQSIFGGEVQFTTFAESGMTEGVAPDGIMHSSLTGGPVELMASDAMQNYEVKDGSRVWLALTGPSTDEATLRGWYEQLSEGAGEVTPLDLAPWGDYFGQFTDRFGIRWMFDIGAPQVPDDASSLTENQAM